MARRSAIGTHLRPRDRGRGEEASGLGDGDVEPADTLEAGPSRADAPTAPVADGALRCTDEIAELLEHDQAVVVPVLGDVDGCHHHVAFRRGRRPIRWPSPEKQHPAARIGRRLAIPVEIRVSVVTYV